MKLIKAKCSKTNKPLVLQATDDGRQVLGYFKTDNASYEGMSSQVRLAPDATTKAGVRCGSDDSRYRATRCGGTTTFDPKCLVCPYLQPVYTRASGRGCVQLKAGEVADIDLTHIKVGCNWDSYVDIDSSVIVDSPSSYELVYFGHKDDTWGCVHHRGDNLVGGRGVVAGTEDSENIDVYLEKVPSSHNRLIFVINIYTSGMDDFSAIRGLKLTIYNSDTNEPLISYNVEQNFRGKQSLVIGEARRNGGGWEFKAIGEGTVHSSVSALADYCHGKHW